MDQFQCCRLVDGVSVGPVDTNLEGFLDGGNQEGIRGVGNNVKVAKCIVAMDCITLHFGNILVWEHNLP